MDTPRLKLSHNGQAWANTYDDFRWAGDSLCICNIQAHHVQ